MVLGILSYIAAKYRKSITVPVIKMTAEHLFDIYVCELDILMGNIL